MRTAAWSLVVLCTIAVPLDAQPVPGNCGSDEQIAVIAAFYSVDREVPFDATVFRRQHSGYPLEEIVFTAAAGARVRGYLIRPRDNVNAVPLAVLIHSMTGTKDNWLQEASLESGWLLTQQLLEAGIAVFMMDARFHGDRMHENDFQFPWTMYEKGQWSRMRDMIVGTARDYRRAIQYLRGRDDIDGEHLTLLGYSLGGTIGYALAALEEVAGLVAVVPWTVGLGRYALAADFNTAAVDTRTFAPRLAGSSLLLIAGDRDPNYTVEEVRELGALTPGSAVSVYAGAHRLPAAYTREAAEWIVGRGRKE